MLESLKMFIQVVIALGVFNVWLIRFGKSTSWRGGNAKDLRTEFEVYGLPNWFMLLIGFTKVVLACCLIAGLWFPVITTPAAWALAVLMLGAVTMHIKVGDPVLKSLPATCMFLMALFVALV